jgi:excisionase family DNA binding protein
MMQSLMATIITSGISYAQLLADLTAAIRTELASMHPSPAASPEVGGIKLAQEITRLSESRIYALVSARGIPHYKRGNKLYFSRTELIAWVKEGSRYGKEVAYA